VVLGFPKPLEYTDSWPYQIFDLLGLQWKEPNVVLYPNSSPSGMGQISQALWCSTLHLVSSTLSLLTAFCSLCLLSPFFRVCVPSASLCMALKPLELMSVQFLFQLRWITCYSFAWGSLSQRHYQTHREWPLVLLWTAPACFVGSVL